MKQRRCEWRGFSLIEVVFVIFLAGIVMFCVAKLTQNTLNTLTSLERKAEIFQGATLGCERLASEMREMIGSATIGATAVTFRKIAPTLPGAIPREQTPLAVGNDPEADPMTWDREYTNLSTVRYFTTGEQLMRQVDSHQATLVANHVNDFRVTPNGVDGSYRIALSMRDQRRIYVFETLVYCPGVEQSP